MHMLGDILLATRSSQNGTLLIPFWLCEKIDNKFPVLLKPSEVRLLSKASLLGMVVHTQP